MWRAARVVKANPDLPQLPVRARALTEGKRVYMAVPRLTSAKPFLLLHPARVRGAVRRAASISGAMRVGAPVAVEDMERIDLVVCGTVAVNAKGVRVGKGGGYSDLEFALLVDANFVDSRTVLATTVHDLQLVDEELPETEHDFRVDLIVTPTRTVRLRRPRRPPGILWSHLDEEKIGQVPALTRLRTERD